MADLNKQELEAIAAIRRVTSMVQRLQGKLFAELEETGVEPIDALIGALYATHQYAAELHKDRFAAVEWMRNAIDTIERQLLELGEPN